MTTPAKPERMTDEEFDAHESEVLMGHHVIELINEARRARSEEEGLTRQVDGLWDLAEALAHELGRHIEARLEAEKEREESRRLHNEFVTDLGAILGLGPDEKFDDAARRVVAERDAAREEAERLRASKKRIADGLTKLRAKVERGLNLAEYLRALNELESDHADE